MGFLDTLRHILGSERDVRPDWRLGAAWTHQATGADDESTAYDRAQWRKKLKRVLDELPGARPEWDGLMAEARALGFEPDWVARCQSEEFALLVRRAVADRVVTEAEHRKIDLARDLIGIPEADAEAALHAIVAEAESFFGKPVEET